MNVAIIVLITTVVLGGIIFFVARQDSQLLDNQNVSETSRNTGDTTSSEVPSQAFSGSQRTLNLSGQGITKVSSSVFNQTDIEVLNISNNNLDGALQAEVRHLQNLRVLDLSDNNFTGVPAEVGQLSKLEVLDLSNNPITGLPYEIGNLKNLQVLDLRGTNYAKQDLDVIRQGLSSDVEIRVD